MKAQFTSPETWPQTALAQDRCRLKTAAVDAYQFDPSPRKLDFAASHPKQL